MVHLQWFLLLVSVLLSAKNTQLISNVLSVFFNGLYIKNTCCVFALPCHNASDLPGCHFGWYNNPAKVVRNLCNELSVIYTASGAFPLFAFHFQRLTATLLSSSSYCDVNWLRSESLSRRWDQHFVDLAVSVVRVHLIHYHLVVSILQQLICVHSFIPHLDICQ